MATFIALDKGYAIESIVCSSVTPRRRQVQGHTSKMAALKTKKVGYITDFARDEGCYRAKIICSPVKKSPIEQRRNERPAWVLRNKKLFKLCEEVSIL